MRFPDVNSLMEYRASASKTQKVEEHDCPSIQLYGVSRKLDKPVISFVKISKKYLYDAEGNKYPFRFCMDNIEDSPIAVFTTEAEAWKFFKAKTLDRWEIAEDFFIKEMKILRQAEKIMLEKEKEFPEYFI